MMCSTTSIEKPTGIRFTCTRFASLSHATPRCTRRHASVPSFLPPSPNLRPHPPPRNSNSPHSPSVDVSLRAALHPVQLKEARPPRLCSNHFNTRHTSSWWQNTKWPIRAKLSQEGCKRSPCLCLRDAFFGRYVVHTLGYMS
jgi:hypothetical protein